MTSAIDDDGDDCTIIQGITCILPKLGDCEMCITKSNIVFRHPDQKILLAFASDALDTILWLPVGDKMNGIIFYKIPGIDDEEQWDTIILQVSRIQWHVVELSAMALFLLSMEDKDTVEGLIYQNITSVILLMQGRQNTVKVSEAQGYSNICTQQPYIPSARVFASPVLKTSMFYGQLPSVQGTTGLLFPLDIGLAVLYDDCAILLNHNNVASVVLDFAAAFDKQDFGVMFKGFVEDGDEKAPELLCIIDFEEFSIFERYLQDKVPLIERHIDYGAEPISQQYKTWSTTNRELPDDIISGKSGVHVQESDDSHDDGRDDVEPTVKYETRARTRGQTAGQAKQSSLSQSKTSKSKHKTKSSTAKVKKTAKNRSPSPEAEYNVQELEEARDALEKNYSPKFTNDELDTFLKDPIDKTDITKMKRKERDAHYLRLRQLVNDLRYRRQLARIHRLIGASKTFVEKQNGAVLRPIIYGWYPEPHLSWAQLDSEKQWQLLQKSAANIHLGYTAKDYTVLQSVKGYYTTLVDKPNDDESAEGDESDDQSKSPERKRQK